MRHDINNVSSTLCALSVTLLFSSELNAQEPASFPDRASFAAHPRTYARVDPSALELTEDAARELKVEVWATSPLIFSPVAIDVDAKGRLWCTEGIDYNAGRRIAAGQSIVVLTDTDGDGKADKSHVFVTERNLRHAPMGIAVFDNKIVLSATPDLIVYTDVNRNGVFEPGLDQREVLLTGFQGGGHDHTLHAAVGAPSGQWYFSYGNMGANIKTRDGQQFLSASYYGYADMIGKDSSDGHRYVGGVAMRINPDGTGLRVVGQNLRNTHDMAVTSFGDVLHNDNDDPAHCRATWLMEYGNLGYADLLDGSKSWEEVAKSWEEDRNAGPAPFGYERIHGTGVIRSSATHWRENYPGTIPPGDVYGAGSPTGVTFIEGDELGKAFRGRYLACDMVHKAVLGYSPKHKDAQIEMGLQHKFLALKKGSENEPFLPTDVIVGTDGSLFVSDFYNSTSRRTVELSGTIYRISRKDETRPRAITINYETTEGLIAALQNPAASIRSTAASLLVKQGESALPAVRAFYDQATNPYHRARAVWVAAQLGEPGMAFVKPLLSDDDEQMRIVAYRALRFASPTSMMSMAAAKATDASPAVRREVALSLRDIPFETCKDVLRTLIEKYEGNNRWSLEAIGTACTKKEQAVYDQIIRPALAKTPPFAWDNRTKSLAWRLHTPQAVDDLFSALSAKQATLTEFRWLIMALASFDDEAQRTKQEKLVEKLAELPLYSGDEYQLTISEVLQRDLHRPEAKLLRANYLMPQFTALTELTSVEQIAKLKGNAERGKERATSCLACHKINGAGIAFGPNLSSWGNSRTPQEIITAIVDPAEKLAHGYEQPVRIVAGKFVAEGMLSNYSYHAGSLKLKVFGGETHKILFRQSGARIDYLKNFSWMPSAAKLGLTDQDVRDIASYLQHTSGKPEVSP